MPPGDMTLSLSAADLLIYSRTGESTGESMVQRLAGIGYRSVGTVGTIRVWRLTALPPLSAFAMEIGRGTHPYGAARNTTVPAVRDRARSIGPCKPGYVTG